MPARARRGLRRCPGLNLVKPKAGLAKPVSSADDGPADTTKYPIIR